MTTKPAEIVKMPSSRITTKELHREIEIIKDNHLAHMAEDIDELKDSIKDNREFFTKRMDQLDNRIWWIMGLTVSTLIALLS